MNVLETSHNAQVERIFIITTLKFIVICAVGAVRCVQAATRASKHIVRKFTKAVA